MLTVKDNWKDVKVGDRVRVRYPFQGADGFEASVLAKGGQSQRGGVSGAWFTDNVTLKRDGTPRKTSAKERRNQDLSPGARFEIVESVSIPKTAGELTDAHIGMEFRFHGSPIIDGTYTGREKADIYWVNDVTYDSWREGDGDGVDPHMWGTVSGGDYYIPSEGELTYLGGTPKKVDETVDTDAKLAAYFNQELAKTPGFRGVGQVWLDNQKVGESIVEILKTLTK